MNLRSVSQLLLLLAGISLLLGCRSATKHPAASSRQPASAEKPGLAPTNAPAAPRKWRSITVTPPTNRPAIHWYNKINPIWWLKNIDDPLPPPKYKPKDKLRVMKWYFRNSFHNFTFYVIGIADKEFVRSGRYPNEVMNPNGGWNFAVSRYKCLALPFMSYRRGGFDFYVGWRNRGNFGAKLNYNNRPRRTTPLPEPKPKKPIEQEQTGKTGAGK